MEREKYMTLLPNEGVRRVIVNINTRICTHSPDSIDHTKSKEFSGKGIFIASATK
jgi:hypothetical protein